MNIYDYNVINVKGEEVSLEKYKGKVLMIINTATGCGFTPQYKDLQEIYEKFHEKGLEIIDIPCNQFAGQAPGTDEEIHKFCTLNFGTEFPQMKKSNV
ncbi:MAG: redoxin domain-containing protein, partial [Fusobacterium sp.]